MSALVKHHPKQVSGKGWAVVRRVGSRKTGFTETMESEPVYTLAQAQIVSDQMDKLEKRNDQ